MKQPVTELDTRFSDQDAVATDWEETRRADDQTAIQVVDDTVEVVSGGHRKLFTPSPEAS